MFKKKVAPKDVNCLNCSTQFSGWFCPQCGQKSQTRRLTIITVIKDFLDALSDSDKGFLRTVIDLSQHPGAMLKDYVGGKRQRYLSAGKYTFFLVVLFTINISLLEQRFEVFRSATSKLQSLTSEMKDAKITSSPAEIEKKLDDSWGMSSPDDSEEVFINLSLFDSPVRKVTTQKKLLEFITNHLPTYHQSLFNFLKIFLAIWIPIFSFFTFIFFRKSKFNMAEHIAINSYIYSHLLLVSILLSGFYWLLPPLSGTTLMTTFIVTTFYLAFAYLQIFDQGNWKLFKTLTVIGMGSFTYVMLISFLLVSHIFYVTYLNIDKL